MIIIDVDNYSYFDIGEKATKLFELKEQGFEGPKLFCVNTKHIFRKTFDKYLENNFSDIEFLSVRPSIFIDEDSVLEHDFKIETRLNVTKDELCKVIDECYNEFFNITGVEENSEEIKMSLVIQEMINFDTRGVMLTANPQGIVNEKIVLVGKDSEELNEEDRLNLTTYYYNSTSKQYYYEAEENSFLLDEFIFSRLMEIGNDLEILIGKYLEAEFVINEGLITILQLRTVNIFDDKELSVLDNGDILENYPGITLPLTYSFIKGTYGGAVKNVATRISPDEVNDKMEHIYNNILAMANGRVYYQLTNLKTFIGTMPFSKRVETIWQGMLDVETKELPVDEENINGVKSLKLYLNVVREFININKNIEGLEKEFDKIKEYFNSTFDENLSNQALIEIYDEVNHQAWSLWGISIINDIYTYTFRGLLKERLKRIDGIGYRNTLNKYIAEVTNIVSLKHTNELIELTNYLVKNKKINKLKRYNKDNIDEFLKTKGRTQKLLNKYINEYGDRSLDDMKLETDTYRSSPILLVNKVLEYAEEIEKGTLTVKHLETKTINISDWQAKYFSKKLISGLYNRETSRLSRGRYYGVARTVFLSIGKNLVESGVIEHTRDIFYLFIEEIRSYLNGEEIDLKSIISERKEEYVLYYELPEYNRLVFAGEVFNKHHKNINGVEIGTVCLNSEN